MNLEKCECLVRLQRNKAKTKITLKIEEIKRFSDSDDFYIKFYFKASHGKPSTL